MNTVAELVRGGELEALCLEVEVEGGLRQAGGPAVRVNMEVVGGSAR